MKKNCRFNRSFVRSSCTYTLSFKRLDKAQADFICNVFRSLSPLGVTNIYENGVTMPFYELRCFVPLAPGVKRSFFVPFSLFCSVVSDFGNKEFPIKDVFVSSNGFPFV